MIDALFDDHYQALPTWREAGLDGLTCVHVDAHLDVSTDGFTERSLAGIAKARTREELAAFRGNPRLPWGGLHCGNYLYPALLDGTVTTLIWVVPRDFGEGSFLPSARQTLQSWLDLTLPEYSGLKMVEGAVQGTLLGRRLVVCTCDNMPRLSEEEAARVVLDIDVDYFVRLKDDRMWQTPHQLRECLGDLRPLALTVATSCEGGYTPLSHRFLGDVCLQVFSGDPEAWKAETLDFQQAFDTGLPPLQNEKPRAAVSSPMAAVAAIAGVESVPPPAEDAGPRDQEGEDAVSSSAEEPPSAEELAQLRKEALESFLTRAPDLIKPAVLCALERSHEAAELDPRYTPCMRDSAGRLFQQRRFAEALACLDELKESGSDASFMMAFLAFGNSQLDLSLEQIDKLLAYPGLTDRDVARLLALQAEIVGNEQPKKAVEGLRRALKIEPDRALPYYLLAQHLRRAGDREEAARLLRKALRLCKGKVSSLPMLLDASRLYDEMGQKAMARATRRELEDSDVTGFYAIQSVLDTTR